MRKKDVVLDFTSLLDITLIILFFFILYSAFDVKESQARIEKTRVEYEEKLDVLEEEKTHLNDEWNKLHDEEERLNKEWERVRTLDEHAVQNQQALIGFNNGSMLTFILEKEETNDDWEIRVMRGESNSEEEPIVGSIRPGENLYNSILSLFENAGFEENDVLIVTFAYNGNQIGTHRLYLEIMEAFREVQASRNNVYLNAVNTSK